MKKGISIGIIVLFIVSAVSPMVIGYNVGVSTENYNCYNVAEISISENHYPFKESINNDDIESEEAINLIMTTQPLDGPMNSSWPMFCHDARHTGRSPYGGTGSSGRLKWKFEMGELLYSSPAIDKNGIIYVGSDEPDFDYGLLAVYPNGTEKWRFKTGAPIKSSPAIGADGTIYVGSNDDSLYAVYPNGTKKWRFGVVDSVRSSPTIGDDGTIYFGELGPWWDKGRVHAVYPNSTEKWHYDTGLWIYSSAAIDDNGIIYIGSHDTYLYALYPNGTLKWRYKTGEEVKSPPAIGDDGTVYVGSWDGYLYALYPNGTLKWRADSGDATETSPTLAPDGTIYMGSYDGRLFSIAPNGSRNWVFEAGNPHGAYGIISSPAVDKNGIIYFGSSTNKLYALNPDGTVRWRFAVGNRVYSSPAVGEDGTIYFTSWDGYLYAIEIGENNPPDRPSIDGPAAGEPRTEYTYTANTTDLDGEVSYFFDWDDGKTSGWTGFVPSGEPVSRSHKWLIRGRHKIKVKARDRFFHESEWATLEVRMPKNKQSSNMLFIRFLERHPRTFPILRQLLGL